MSNLKTYTIKKILIGFVWLILAAGSIVLLVAAIQRKDDIKCKEIDISFKGNGQYGFVKTGDVLEVLKKADNDNIIGTPVKNIHLRLLETELEKSIWIKNAELFFDNAQTLHVKIEEREPIARIFTTIGDSYYIDSSLLRLPLSEKFSARLPVFTGYPSTLDILSSLDSILLKQIGQLSTAILKDTFSMALIEQVDITPQATFILIPKIGNYTIEFGTVTDVPAKMQKLKLFYKQIMANESWGKYSSINLQYANQVVARRRGAEDIVADSLRTLQLMQWIADNAEKQAYDSMQTIQQDNPMNTTDSTIILQSLERDDENLQGSYTIEKPLLSQPVKEKPVAPITKPPPPKPKEQKQVKTKPVKPKIIMKPKTE